MSLLTRLFTFLTVAPFVTAQSGAPAGAVPPGAAPTSTATGEEVSCYVQSDNSFGAEIGAPMTQLQQLDGSIKQMINPGYRINGAKACQDSSAMLTGIQFQISEQTPNQWYQTIELWALGDVTSFNIECSELDILPYDHISEVQIYFTSFSQGVSFFKLRTALGLVLERGTAESTFFEYTWYFDVFEPLLGVWGRESSERIMKMGVITFDTVCGENTVVIDPFTADSEKVIVTEEVKFVEAADNSLSAGVIAAIVLGALFLLFLFTVMTIVFTVYVGATVAGAAACLPVWACIRRCIKGRQNSKGDSKIVNDAKADDEEGFDGDNTMKKMKTPDADWGDVNVVKLKRAESENEFDQYLDKIENNKKEVRAESTIVPPEDPSSLKMNRQWDDPQLEDVDAKDAKIVKERDLFSGSPNGWESIAVDKKTKKAKNFMDEIDKMRSQAVEMEQR